MREIVVASSAKIHSSQSNTSSFPPPSQFAEKADPDLELVTCSGHGKNGALCVLQVFCCCCWHHCECSATSEHLQLCNSAYPQHYCLWCDWSLQRGVRPQVVTTFELPGCTDMWTVLSNTDDQV